MGMEEEVASVISELQAGVDRSLFGSLTLLRTRLIKSSQARAQLLQFNAAKLLLNLLGEKIRHGRQKKIPDLVMSILANLCLDNVASEQILKCGGLETIATYTLAAEHESIQNRGVRALSNLAQHEGVVEELFNLEVPEFVSLRLLQTEDEECRVMYCRAIRQMGKSDSAVRRLVEDTVAVQALAAMLKLDNKTLALKGLRTLAELSALRCCAQFAGQVLGAKIEEELVVFSEEDNSDMAYFALALIYRLCEQGLVRPSLGAAGVVKLFVRLMSSTQRHVNKVSVLNSLCLCSMDSVNRNRILDAGGLEVFVSVLKGEENIKVLSGKIESSESSPSTSKGKGKATSLKTSGSKSQGKTEDKMSALKKSCFRVLYDRIIGCLVNFIYHDKCFTKLVDLGLVDVLLIHLQRCCNYQINNYTDLINESGIMENQISCENENLDKNLKTGKFPIMEITRIKDGSNDTHDVKMVNIQKETENDEGYVENNSSSTRISRHESKGFELQVNPEIIAETDVDQVKNSFNEDKEYEVAHEEVDNISLNIYSRDPLNIDTQDLSSQNKLQTEKTSAESVSGDFSGESNSSAASSRKVKHTFSINSPTYQSEISRRLEDPQNSGVTCKDYSNPDPHLHAQGKSPSSLLSPSWPASPASVPPSSLSSPKGFQSPFSPLGADASYYSPAQSSPPYNCAPFSPQLSLPPHSPSSSTSQAGLSPALSWVSSSIASPGQRSLTSQSPVHISPYQSPPGEALQGSFSPLSHTNFPGSPLHSSGANSQVQEIHSPSSGAQVGFHSSPALFSDTNSQGDVVSLISQSQTLPGLRTGAETLTQGTLTSVSPIYSATDEEDEDEDNKNSNKEQATSSSNEDLFNECHLVPTSGNSLNTVRDKVFRNPDQYIAECESMQDCGASRENNESPGALLDATCSKNGQILGGSNKRFSDLDHCNPSPKCLEAQSDLRASFSLGTKEPVSSKILNSAMKSSQSIIVQEPFRDKLSIPRSTKVAKRYQRMLSAPCLETSVRSHAVFKKRGSIQEGLKIAEATTSAFLCTTKSEDATFSSPSSVCSLTSSSTQQGVAGAGSSKGCSTLSSMVTSGKVQEHKKQVSDEKYKKIKQTTESNIFILLSSCSVRQDILSKLIKTDVLVNLLSYIRNAPAPLQRCFRILKRLFSSQVIFYRLILAHTSTLIIKSLILEDDGTFPKIMFCTEWEDLFGQLRRSRMNLSDLLQFNKSSDDVSATGSQASDFGQRLDFEFSGDAYNMARAMNSNNSLAHRMFRDLYHNIGSLSSESQNSWDSDSVLQGSDLIYQPGVAREETRVRVGLKLLTCLSTVATSSYGEGEIQHLSQGGKPSEQLSCRIFMLHTPVVWGRMIRHQFALKHQLSWDAMLPYLFSENLPVVVKTAIFIGLSFNLHLDFPPKLVKQMTNPAPCPDTSHNQLDAANISINIPTSSSIASGPKSHSERPNLESTSSRNLDEVSLAKRGKLVAEANASFVQIGPPGLGLHALDKASCSSASQSPQLFDEDEEDETNPSNNSSQHLKCVYWNAAKNHNVTFFILENGITFRYGANRATMMQKSEVFAAMLGGAYAERLQAEIKLSDTKAASFECIVHYLHGCTSSTCSHLSFLALNLYQLKHLSGLSASKEEKMLYSKDCVMSNSDFPCSQPAKSQIIGDNGQDTNIKCNKVLEQKPDTGNNYSKTEIDVISSDIELRDTGEAFRMVEELINICSDVLVLADRFLLTELVNRICAVLSHVCLRAHTWEDLFKLASVFKLRPLAVDCMREALLVYEKPMQIVTDLQNLGNDGFADQAIEALTLLLKSARIH